MKLLQPLLAMLLLMICASVVVAQAFDYKSLEITIDGSLEKGEILITIVIPDGYELNAEKEFLQITALKQEGDFKLEFGELKRPDADLVNYLGDHYTGTKKLILPISQKDSGAEGSVTVTFGFLLQVCEQMGRCFPPADPEKLSKTVTLKTNQEPVTARETE